MKVLCSMTSEVVFFMVFSATAKHDGVGSCPMSSSSVAVVHIRILRLWFISFCCHCQGFQHMKHYLLL